MKVTPHTLWQFLQWFGTTGYYLVSFDANRCHQLRFNAFVFWFKFYREIGFAILFLIFVYFRNIHCLGYMWTQISVVWVYSCVIYYIYLYHYHAGIDNSGNATKGPVFYVKGAIGISYLTIFCNFQIIIIVNYIADVLKPCVPYLCSFILPLLTAL